MAKPSTDELITTFKGMTLAELADFIGQFESTFGVQAAAPVPPAPMPATEEPAEPEQDEFDVVIESAGDKKVQVIKEVRTLTSLGLREAKDLVDAAPKLLLEKTSKDAASKAQARLEAAGATVTLR